VARWAGPWWAASWCTLRQIRVGRGPNGPETTQEKKRKENNFFFCFLVLNILLLFANIWIFKFYQIYIYAGAFKTYIRRSTYFRVLCFGHFENISKQRKDL
jgi:hypothetical protein